MADFFCGFTPVHVSQYFLYAAQIIHRECGLGFRILCTGKIAVNLVYPHIHGAFDVCLEIIANHNTFICRYLQGIQYIFVNAAMRFLHANFFRKEHFVEKSCNAGSLQLGVLHFAKAVRNDVHCIAFRPEILQQVSGTIEKCSFFGAFEDVKISQLLAETICFHKSEMLQCEREPGHIQVILFQSAVVVSVPQTLVYDMIGIDESLEIRFAECFKPVLDKHLPKGLHAVCLEIPERAVQIEKQITVFHSVAKKESRICNGSQYQVRTNVSLFCSCFTFFCSCRRTCRLDGYDNA